MPPRNGKRFVAVAALDAARYTDTDSERTERATGERITIAPMVGKVIEILSFSR